MPLSNPITPLPSSTSKGRFGRRSHHEYSPDGLPGLVVAYKYEPASAGRNGGQVSRWEDMKEEFDATVSIEGATLNGADVMNWLEDHGFDWEKLESEILAAHED